MKRILFAVIAAAVLAFAAFCAETDGDEISVYVDGEKVEFDTAPVIIEGRTMVPIRAVFEKIGASVEWNEEQHSALCTKDGASVKMTVGSDEMLVGGEIVKMDAAPIIFGGRTLAPARYAAEAFGKNVQWSEKNNAVVICSPCVYAYADFPDIPDFGKCFSAEPDAEYEYDGYYIFHYICEYTEQGRALYENSSAVLGGYNEEYVDYSGGALLSACSKEQGEPSWYVRKSYIDGGYVNAEILIPLEIKDEKTVTLYSADGRTIDVYESEKDAYTAVGWYETIDEVRTTLYAPDGRTVSVFNAEIPEYIKAGWFESRNEAESSKKSAGVESNDNPEPDGYYYRTPKGKRWHLDPNCGGKNSYRTSDISGLSPCRKCAV